MRFPWVEAIHMILSDDFDLFRRVGGKFNLPTLRLLALSILDKSDNSIYRKRFIDTLSGSLSDM